jgi:Fe2+ or Zn2+ uptake regulation protein
MSTTRAAPEVESLLAHASAFWAARGQRLSIVRRVVATEAFARLVPFDAETLLAAARAKDRGISPASVYRVLSDLVAASLLRSVTGSRGERNYTVVDAPAAGLSHIVCTDCDRVHALPDPCLPMREGPLVRQHGFTPTAMSLRVEASCQELHTTGNCAKRGARKN